MTTKRANELVNEIKDYAILKGYQITVERAYNFNTDKNDTEIQFFKPLEGFDGIVSNGNCIVESFFSVKELKAWLNTLEQPTLTFESVDAEYKQMLENDFNNDLVAFGEYLHDIQHMVSTQIEFDVCQQYIKQANDLFNLEGQIDIEFTVENAHTLNYTLLNKELSEYMLLTLKNNVNLTITSTDSFTLQHNNETIYFGRLFQSKYAFNHLLFLIAHYTGINNLRQIFELISLTRKTLANKMFKIAEKNLESINNPQLKVITNTPSKPKIKKVQMLTKTYVDEVANDLVDDIKTVHNTKAKRNNNPCTHNINEHRHAINEYNRTKGILTLLLQRKLYKNWVVNFDKLILI